MGTAVLRSQDCLRGRFPPATFTSTQKSDRNLKPTRSDRRKRSPSGYGGDRGQTTVVKLPAKNLVMGKVTILKRGEDLKKMTKDRISEDGDDEKKSKIEEEDSVLFSTDRLGPEPEMVPKQIRLSDLKSVNGVYAGSACFSSPSPSSLPFPAFFTKKDGPSPSKIDAATKDLRRLLRLDLL